MLDNFAGAIHSYGSISVINTVSGNKYIVEKDCSTEDYVGKITTIFMPYLNQNMSDKNLISVQNQVKRIITELRGK